MSNIGHQGLPIRAGATGANCVCVLNLLKYY